MNLSEPLNIGIGKEFPREYREEVFQIWYRAGRPSIHKLRPLLSPADLDGRVPSEEALGIWRKDDGWVIRADDLDTEVARRNDRDAIQQKLEMLRRHAAVSMTLIEKGSKFLETTGITKAADAIRAIALGMEGESRSRGFRVALDSMGKKSDEELVHYLEQLVGQATGVGDDVIDGEVKDVSDAES